MKRFVLLLAVCALLLAPAREAQAYLDPSTGGMIVSAVLAFFATLAMAIRTYWHKLLGLFRQQPPESRGAPAEAPERESAEH